MTIEEMKDRKRELGYSYEQLAELAGLPCSTIQKIFGGTTRFPRRATIAALEKALRSPSPLPLPSYSKDPGKAPAGKERDDFTDIYIRKYDTRADEESAKKESAEKETAIKESAKKESAMEMFFGTEADCLREPGGQYRTGLCDREKHTVVEYFHFPQNRGRCELIDGVIYDMASPGAAHQGMSLRLASHFLRHVDENRGDCRVFTAPFDVVPDPADKYTVVQPDVMIICDPSKMRNGYCEGAPDLVVEILSPSTRRRDLILKHAKYAAAGVREYWIVDIEAQAVVIYDFEHDALPRICGFSEPVPVGIWNGECRVDFAAILSKL